MQVNSVQQSPNFGMALKIKPEAVDALKNATRNEIENLQKIGELLKDTKYYHLEIGDGRRTIVSPFASKYMGGTVHLEQPKDQLLEFDAAWAGSESGNLKRGDRYKSAIKFADTEAAINAYNDIVSSNGNIALQDAKLVKYLDAREIEKEAEAATIKAEKNAISQMVDDLFTKYPG